MQRGQVLMIVLLVLGVGLTIGLAIVSRSVTDVNISTTQEESVRALNAAEAGIEQALGGIITNNGSGSVPAANADFNVNTSDVGGGSTYEVPFKLEQGDTASVDVSDMDRNGQLRVCWGQSGSSPAIEVIMYYTSGGNTYSVRNGFDNSGRANFISSGVSSGCGGMSGNYAFQRQIRFSQTIAQGGFNLGSGTQPVLLRIRMLYNTSPQPLAVRSIGGGDLAAQGKDIISTGVSGSSTQKLRVLETNPDLPSIFDSAIFSGAGVQK